MKESYINLLLNNDDNVLLRYMFSIVWWQRSEYGDPEESHPDWERVKPLYDSLCSDENYDSLWSLIECFCETYYIIGLKQGLKTSHNLLPCVNVVESPFDSATEG